jgi:2,3-bisphosphoglycerate-independent phosphoglycerate mutase
MSSDSKTKYLILVPDGMADSPDPCQEVDTPLKASKTPNMDRVASAGSMGLTWTVPDEMEPGSDVANLSLMGYSPLTVYTGRAPFEAASMGVELGPDDLAFRMNLVTLDRNFTLMADHSADHISTPEAREIVASLAPYIESLGMTVVPGVSYRNLLVWENGPEGCRTYAPHDFPGEPVAPILPSGNGASQLLQLIVKSWKILVEHPVNQRRKQRCQGAANSVWPWGQGKPPRLKTLRDRFGIEGTVVAAVDLVRGIGKYAGLRVVDVLGATGYLDTNYQGKVDAALASLNDGDFVFLHVEAPDEAGHSGQRDLKMKAIEDFDEKVVGPVLKGLEAFDQWRLIIVPDHQTPVATRIHTKGPVPFILLDSKAWSSTKEASVVFSEEAAQATGKTVPEASKLMEVLLGRE